MESLEISKKIRKIEQKNIKAKNINNSEIKNLKMIDKDIIILLGNDMKLKPKEEYNHLIQRSLAKDKKELKNKLNDKYNPDTIELSLKKLFNYGLITFTTTLKNSTGIIRNQKSIRLMYEKELDFGKMFEREEGWFPIRLTNRNEREITGIMVYEMIKNEFLNQKIKTVSLKQKEITNKINNFYTKIIEIITIFIAVFSLILINYNLFSNLLNKNIVDNLSLIFIINGSLSLILTNLFLFIHKIIYQEEDNKKWLQFYLPSLLFILIGILILNI